MPVGKPKLFLADKGYDGDYLREELLIHGIRPVIPPKANRKNPPACDFRVYKDRNSIERMFNRLKQFRRVATRYDKTRKSFSAFLALAAALVASSALAQGYPAKPITLVVPASAGGTTDLAGRMLAQGLSGVVGQQVVVDNKAGGNGAIATSIVKRAPADGYTLLMQYSGYHVISPHLMKQRQWELADFQPIANVLSAPQIIVVRDDVPVKTLAELVAYAKAHPGKLNYASSGNGSLQHVTGAMLEQQAGIKMVHVPYKGGAPAMADLLAGHVSMLFDQMPAVMPQVKAGKVRALGVSSAQRSAAAPDLPTLAEAGLPGFDMTVWFGILAPAHTPAAIVSRVNGEMRKLLADAEFRTFLAGLGVTPMPGTPEEFAATLASETTRWARVVRESGARID